MSAQGNPSTSPRGERSGVLADGHHRYSAAKRAGQQMVPVNY